MPRKAKGTVASVADVRLDKYEVTVGRFRRFVEAWAAGWRPGEGSGKHVHLNDGRGLVDAQGGAELGWNSAWTKYVGAPSASAAAPTRPGATTAADFGRALACAAGQSTWTPAVGSNDDKPQNCVSWYDLHAFCLWDGGFLPSEAEWEFAAAGGAEARSYPWGKEAPTAESGHAVFGTAGASSVGRFAAGDGRFGQSDLAGNVWEWTLDAFGSLDASCTNCARLSGSADRMLRGGAFVNDAGYLGAAVRISSYPALRSETAGGRCARRP
jgi:formylglycine-generating enzyme required for sulfatase activity